MFSSLLGVKAGKVTSGSSHCSGGPQPLRRFDVSRRDSESHPLAIEWGDADGRSRICRALSQFWWLLWPGVEAGSGVGDWPARGFTSGSEYN